MRLILGSARYGIHVETWRWGLAVFCEWRGETYGGQWSL